MPHAMNSCHEFMPSVTVPLDTLFNMLGTTNALMANERKGCSYLRSAVTAVAISAAEAAVVSNHKGSLSSQDCNRSHSRPQDNRSRGRRNL